MYPSFEVLSKWSPAAPGIMSPESGSLVLRIFLVKQFQACHLTQQQDILILSTYLPTTQLVLLISFPLKSSYQVTSNPFGTREAGSTVTPVRKSFCGTVSWTLTIVTLCHIDGLHIYRTLPRCQQWFCMLCSITIRRIVVKRVACSTFGANDAAVNSRRAAQCIIFTLSSLRSTIPCRNQTHIGPFPCKVELCFVKTFHEFSSTVTAR